MAVRTAMDDALESAVQTGRVPGVVATVRALPARRLVLDGEAMGLAADGRPLPFQEISSRAAIWPRSGPGIARMTPHILWVFR